MHGDYYLNNVETSTLWNTEALVSIISSKWLGQTLPEEIVQHIGNLLAETNWASCCWWYNHTIRRMGWTERPASKCWGPPTFGGPFLRNKKKGESPLTGCNVIEEIITGAAANPPTGPHNSADMKCIISSFDNVNESKAEVLTNFLYSSCCRELCSIRP